MWQAVSSSRTWCKHCRMKEWPGAGRLMMMLREVMCNVSRWSCRLVLRMSNADRVTTHCQISSQCLRRRLLGIRVQTYSLVGLCTVQKNTVSLWSVQKDTVSRFFHKCHTHWPTSNTWQVWDSYTYNYHTTATPTSILTTDSMWTWVRWFRSILFQNITSRNDTGFYGVNAVLSPINSVKENN